MKLFIRTLTEASYGINVESGDTIQQLKNKIYQHIGVLPHA